MQNPALDLGTVPISVQEMIEELLRELRQRAVVYPRLISQGKLDQRTADHQTKVMEEIVALLRERHLGGSTPQARSHRSQLASDPPLKKRPWPTGMLGELVEGVQHRVAGAGFTVAEIGVHTRAGLLFRAPIQPCRTAEETIQTTVLRLREAYARLLAEHKEREQEDG